MRTVSAAGSMWAGELYTWVGDAESRRTHAALHIAGVRYAVRRWVPGWSWMHTWATSGFKLVGWKATPPVLLWENGVTVGALAVTRRIDTANVLLPLNDGGSVARAVAAADVLVAYAEALRKAWCASHPELMLPRMLRPWRFFRFLSAYIYGRAHVPVQTAALAALKEARALLSRRVPPLRGAAAARLKFVNGTHCTFGDIALADAIFFAGDRAPVPFRTHKFAADFPDLAVWALAVREAYYPAEMRT